MSSLQSTFIVSPDHVFVDVPGASKRELIDNLLSMVAEADDIVDEEAVREAVYEREERMSTGIGDGIAIPHARTASMKSVVTAFARTLNPVDFDSIDGAPVSLVYLVLGPNNAAVQHVRLLSRMSRVLHSAEVRKQILEASDTSEVYTIITTSEKH